MIRAIKLIHTLQAAAVFILGGAALSAAAQPLPHGAHHSPAPAGQHSHAAASATELGTSAALDAQGVLWVASKGSDSQGRPLVLLRSSADMGKTWSAPRPVAQDAVTARGEERPQIAFGKKGEMFILYTSPLPGSRNPHVGQVRLLRSVDGGRHFSEPLVVHANRDAIVHAFGNLLVDGEGRVFVTWIDGRDAVAARAGGQAYAGSALYYAVSTDGGASFKGDYRIADHTCECCRVGLSLNPQGQPVALWRHVFEGGIRDHALARLAADGKASPLQRASFDDWQVQACPHHGPSLAYSTSGRRHQVWFSGKEGEGSGVRYASAQPDGKLGKPQSLGSPQAAHADVATQGRKVAVAWKQFNGVATVILARSSEDEGERWQEKELARTEGDSDRPRLITSRSGIHLLWHTRNEGLRVIPVFKEPA